MCSKLQFTANLTMTKPSLSDMLSQLCLDGETEDRLAFYLSFLRRRGKNSVLFSKKACFITNLETSKWVYLELRKIEDKFVWGCSICENLKTFRNIIGNQDIFKKYCIHAQVASMMFDKEEIERKYNEHEEVIEVLSETCFRKIYDAGTIQR